MTPRMFYTLARVLAALTVIPFHEAGHALAAWLLGDPTACLLYTSDAADEL